MRVFLSNLKYFTLAVPIEFVSSIIIFRNNDDFNKDNEYISLPEIFNYKDIETHHGIALKNSNCVLLTAKVDSEADVPKQEIFAIPKTLESLQFSRFFYGIKITNDQLILFLNPEQLIKNIKEVKL